MFFNNLTISF